MELLLEFADCTLILLSLPPMININIRIFSVTWGVLLRHLFDLKGQQKVEKKLWPDSLQLFLWIQGLDCRKKALLTETFCITFRPKGGGREGLLKYILLSTHFLKSEFCFWTSLVVKTIHKAFILKLLVLPNSVPKDNLPAARLNKDTLSPEEAWCIYCSDSVTNGHLKNVHLKWVWSAQAECMCMCIHNSRKLHS